MLFPGYLSISNMNQQHCFTNIYIYIFLEYSPHAIHRKRGKVKVLIFKSFDLKLFYNKFLLYVLCNFHLISCFLDQTSDLIEYTLCLIRQKTDRQNM